MSRIAALILAAGLSTRMEGGNKLLRPVQGRPMVLWVAEACLEAGLWPGIVVLGRQASAVRAALAELPLRFVPNPDPGRGLASSLVLGIEAVPEECDGVMVCLGDMPLVTAGHIRRLTAGFDGTPTVPVHEGRRGNPVLWGRSHFAALRALRGDRGGRDLLTGTRVREVVMPDDAVLRDMDTAEDLAQDQRCHGLRPTRYPIPKKSRSRGV
ncbi:MAG: NTP transferase domain-containing protein [Alphaproteobacteria bacterium]